MSIESSIKWLSKRLTNEYDIKAMNEIIEWFNDQTQININQNFLFAKLFIHKLVDLKYQDQMPTVTKENQKAMVNILKLDLDEYYRQLTDVLNENYIKAVLHENGVDTSKHLTKTKQDQIDEGLKLANMSKDDIKKIKDGDWQYMDVRDRVNLMMSNALNKLQ